jgi:excisionase family DNA binding protein
MGSFELSDTDIARIAEAVAKRIAPVATDGTATTRWLNSKEAAAHLGVSVRTIHELTAQGVLPHHQTGPNARCFFRVAELDQARDQGLV